MPRVKQCGVCLKGNSGWTILLPYPKKKSIQTEHHKSTRTWHTFLISLCESMYCRAIIQLMNFSTWIAPSTGLHWPKIQKLLFIGLGRPGDKATHESVDANSSISAAIVLTTEHLPELANILSPAAFKWYSIGLQLYIQTGRLEALGQEALRTTDHFTKMLTEWLNTAQPHPTVSSLVRALESPTVCELRLAEKVRRAFE